MTEDRIYATGMVAEDFAFNERVAEVFDDMLQRSVPHYSSVLNGMTGLLAKHLKPGARVYDLGCSTGAALLELSRRLEVENIRYVGIDQAPAMLAKARSKSQMYSKEQLLEFRQGDITTCPLPEATAIICNYTLQFLRPLIRQAFVRRLYEALPPGGLFILSEKTISHAGRLNRDFIELYHAFKRKQGYSELEIAAKREALENVLVPFSLQENMHLLQEAGFAEFEVFFKWFNFTSFVALKA